MISTNSNKRQANFIISVRTITALKENVAPRKQSEFVEEAIQRALRQKLFLKALDECKGAWQKQDHPSNTESFIRSLRNSKRI